MHTIGFQAVERTGYVACGLECAQGLPTLALAPSFEGEDVVDFHLIVLDTAERLFAGRSSRSVGMDELVRETGLGKMTVYRLFKSKDDLVGAYLARKAATVDPIEVIRGQ